MPMLLPDRKLIELFLAGTPAGEIIRIQEAQTGVRVSKAYIAREKHRLARQYGVVLTGGRRPQPLIPWTVLSEHTWHPLRVLLDLECRRRENEAADRPAHPLTEADHLRLADFHRRLAGGWVVDYAGDRGFRLVRRRPGVDDDIIRWPDPRLDRGRSRPGHGDRAGASLARRRAG